MRNQAIELRRKEKTYPEICKELGVKIPKGTLSGWFKGMKMSDGYYERRSVLEKNGLHFAQKKAVQVNRKRLEERLNRLAEKNLYLMKKINRESAFLMLSMLYWAEGAKYPTTSQISFSNSDPGMIRVFILLLRKCFSIDKTKLRGGVQCRADQDVDKLEEFWSQVSGIPRTSFQKTRIDPRTIGKPTKKEGYKGVFVLMYFDTDVQLELQLFGYELGKTWARSSPVEYCHGMAQKRVQFPSGPQVDKT